MYHQVKSDNSNKDALDGCAYWWNKSGNLLQKQPHATICKCNKTAGRRDMCCNFHHTYHTLLPLCMSAQS